MQLPIATLNSHFLTHDSICIGAASAPKNARMGTIYNKQLK